MSIDLKYLAFTAILTASLWIPYVVCEVMTNGPLAPPNYIDPTPPRRGRCRCGAGGPTAPMSTRSRPSRRLRRW